MDRVVLVTQLMWQHNLQQRVVCVNMVCAHGAACGRWIARGAAQIGLVTV